MEDAKTMVFSVIAILFIILVVSTIFGAFYIISAGQRGVLLTFGRAAEYPQTEGLHFKFPFVQKIIKMDIKTQKYISEASAASKDLQIVTTEVTTNYYAEPEQVVEIYKTIGVNYEDKIIQPVIQEAVKASTALYTAEELITKRQEVKERIDTELREKLKGKGIVLQDVLITNFDFSDSFNQAIESKVTAEQNALAAKNKLEQVKYEAEQRIAQSKAEAEAIKIQAEAIQSQGGKDYVQLQAISKWNGVLPRITSEVIPFININSEDIN